ncbi:MAG: hypothetical protein QGH45_15195 [Myxococcota bacterium]|jgi:hypothetical protein|nr:hypothetical protein [Myxococcota bacterium]
MMDEEAVAPPPCCARCGTVLSTGSLRYVTEVTVTADFDPVLVIPENIDAEIDRTLQGMQDAADQGLAGQLEEQVVARRTFLLCPGCRAEFLESIPGRLQ